MFKFSKDETFSVLAIRLYIRDIVCKTLFAHTARYIIINTSNLSQYHKLLQFQANLVLTSAYRIDSIENVCISCITFLDYINQNRWNVEFFHELTFTLTYIKILQKKDSKRNLHIVNFLGLLQAKQSQIANFRLFHSLHVRYIADSAVYNNPESFPHRCRIWQ